MNTPAMKMIALAEVVAQLEAANSDDLEQIMKVMPSDLLITIRDAITAELQVREES